MYLPSLQEAVPFILAAVLSFLTTKVVSERVGPQKEWRLVYEPYVIVDRTRTRKWTVFRRSMKLCY